MTVFDLFTGKGLRGARELRGLSRKALAKAAGIDPYTVRYWEKKPHWEKQGWAMERMLMVLGMGHSRTGTRAQGVGSNPRLMEVGKVVEMKMAAWREKQAVAASKGRVRCGAKTRKGHPCRAKSIPGKRRCKFHGGMSTGPKTQEGKDRISAIQRARWKRWRAAQAEQSARA